MNMFLSAMHGFDIKSLLPIVILLGLAAIIPVILSLLKIKFIPVLVIEIISGILLASFASREIFITDGHLSPLSNGLYVVGMGILLFLSGLDSDFEAFKYVKGKHSIRINLLTNLLLLGVIAISVLCSFLFLKHMENKVVGVILLAITLSSTFASIVIPIVHDENLSHTTIGRIISNYSTKSELLSILALSVLMIVLGLSSEQKPWLLTILVVVLVLIYLFTRYVKLERFKKISGGIVHFGVRAMIAVLIGLMILCSISGVEYILGAFLAGMIFKSTQTDEGNIHKFEIIGYGVFIPMFYILVGFKVGLTMPIQEIFLPENILLILALFGAMILVKIPFAYLIKWFKLSTVIQTTLFVACTLIVAIAAEEFGVFTEHFSNALVVASCLTCIIPPILFDITKRFGYSRNENDTRIENPHEV